MTIENSSRVAVVTEFLERIGRLDIHGAGELLHDDAVMVFPYLDTVRDVVGKSAIIEQIEATVPKILRQMHFTYDAWYPVLGSDCLIGEYHSQCPRVDGGIYENSYISIFKFTGDRISFYKEYMNPLPVIVYDGNMGPSSG